MLSVENVEEGKTQESLNSLIEKALLWPKIDKEDLKVFRDGRYTKLEESKDIKEDKIKSIFDYKDGRFCYTNNVVLNLNKCLSLDKYDKNENNVGKIFVFKGNFFEDCGIEEKDREPLTLCDMNEIRWYEEKTPVRMDGHRIYNYYNILHLMYTRNNDKYSLDDIYNVVIDLEKGDYIIWLRLYRPLEEALNSNLGLYIPLYFKNFATSLKSKKVSEIKQELQSIVAWDKENEFLNKLKVNGANINEELANDENLSHYIKEGVRTLVFGDTSTGGSYFNVADTTVCGFSDEEEVYLRKLKIKGENIRKVIESVGDEDFIPNITVIDGEKPSLIDLSIFLTEKYCDITADISKSEKVNGIPILKDSDFKALNRYGIEKSFLEIIENSYGILNTEKSIILNTSEEIKVIIENFISSEDNKELYKKWYKERIEDNEIHTDEKSFENYETSMNVIYIPLLSDNDTMNEEELENLRKVIVEIEELNILIVLFNQLLVLKGKRTSNYYKGDNELYQTLANLQYMARDFRKKYFDNSMKDQIYDIALDMMNSFYKKENICEKEYELLRFYKYQLKCFKDTSKHSNFDVKKIFDKMVNSILNPVEMEKRGESTIFDTFNDYITMTGGKNEESFEDEKEYLEMINKRKRYLTLISLYPIVLLNRLSGDKLGFNTINDGENIEPQNEVFKNDISKKDKLIENGWVEITESDDKIFESFKNIEEYIINNLLKNDIEGISYLFNKAIDSLSQYSVYISSKRAKNSTKLKEKINKLSYLAEVVNSFSTVKKDFEENGKSVTEKTIRLYVRLFIFLYLMQIGMMSFFYLNSDVSRYFKEFQLNRNKKYIKEDFSILFMAIIGIMPTSLLLVENTKVTQDEFIEDEENKNKIKMELGRYVFNKTNEFINSREKLTKLRKDFVELFVELFSEIFNLK